MNAIVQLTKRSLLPAMILGLVSAAIAHFVAPQEFTPSVPNEIPFPSFVVFFTGVIEILAAIGLLLPRFRKLTAYLLVAYFIAILPAHFEMIIIRHEIFGVYGHNFFVARVFLQLALVLVAWNIRQPKNDAKSVLPVLDRLDELLAARWQQPDAWHSKWLWAAAWYNLGFGYWVVIYPEQAFELFRMEVPTYPFIWQSVGMIVGVYGIGYAIAAFDEMKHWVIVLVGWLGKIFGPIGFIYTFINGDIALLFGTILIFNDLIWYPAFFGMMLKKFKRLANGTDQLI